MNSFDVLVIKGFTVCNPEGADTGGGSRGRRPPSFENGGSRVSFDPPPFSRYKLKVYCGFLTNAVSNWIWSFPILKIKFILISALKHIIIVYSNITATSKRCRNFTKAKMYSTWNSNWHPLKIKCLQKSEMGPFFIVWNVSHLI